MNKFVKETARVAGKKAHTVSQPGLQQLDGVQATTYARIRSTAGGDFTRTERQRLVIEKIAEKAQQSDLATINKIIDELFPTIKTSFSATEILSYAKDFMKYKIGESSGFPFDKTTATISGLGSIVIPVDLDTNVQELHKFLYDKEGYQPSSEVQAISGAIVSRVGQREATDDSTLNSQTYTPTAEDKAQEQNVYTVPDGDGNSGGNHSSGNKHSGGNSSDQKEPSKEPTENNKPSTDEGETEKPSPGEETEKPVDPQPDTGETDKPSTDEGTEKPVDPQPGGGTDNTGQ